ncbi:hypothetical protein SUGI_0901670 [Cryptomeria japonica]|nr:hypothetical protein SUGI_0901670 [Cryptomeria japonica]
MVTTLITAMVNSNVIQRKFSKKADSTITYIHEHLAIFSPFLFGVRSVWNWILEETVIEVHYQTSRSLVPGPIEEGRQEGQLRKADKRASQLGF